jgi:soluble lytic murein transglycosylase-like protein
LRKDGPVCNIAYVKWFLIAICVASAVAQPVRSAANLEKQQQSVQKQLNRTPGSFFVSPWLPRNEPEKPATAIEANCEPLPEGQIAQLIAAAARDHGVSPQLLRAVIRHESGGRACAVSPKGAQGLMQLMPATQQTLGVADPFDASANLNGGAKYLSDLLKRYKGDLRRTLAAYNAGPQRVDPEGEIPDIPETKAYVAAIVADVEGQKFPDP